MKKTCTICSLEKNLSGFRKDRSHISGYRSECKVCSRSKQKSRYMETNGSYIKDRTRKTHKRSMEFLIEIKKRGCELCPEKEPCCIDFHHKDPTQKDYTISSMTMFSIEKIQREIDKCMRVCSNCHRKIHAGTIGVRETGNPQASKALRSEFDSAPLLPIC